VIDKFIVEMSCGTDSGESRVLLEGMVKAAEALGYPVLHVTVRSTVHGQPNLSQFPHGSFDPDDNQIKEI
jgi:hypothetical protein